MTTLLRGVDVSHHNPVNRFDWSELGQTHQFLIARATYGSKPDASCIEHVQRAREFGLTVGIYAFFRPGQSVHDQLSAFNSVANMVGLGPGDILPALDVERSKYDGEFAPARYVDQCHAIVEAWRKLYGGAIVYTNPDDWRALGSPEWLRDCRRWIAHWTKPPPTVPLGLTWDIWQWKVAPLPGIYSREVDQNLAHDPLPLIPATVPSVDDWDEEEVTDVTQFELQQSGAELKRKVSAFLASFEPERDRGLEMADRDAQVRESDDPEDPTK
jgi:hypothetical protein